MVLKVTKIHKSKRNKKLLKIITNFFIHTHLSLFIIPQNKKIIKK